MTDLSPPPIQIRSRPWVILYVLISVPALLILCFVTHVFRSPDEQAHFLRVIQLSQGHLLPSIGPDQHSTGSYQSKGVAEFADLYKYENSIASGSKASLAEIEDLYKYKDEGESQFVPHSNTTVYLPTAYLPSLLGLTIAKQFSSRPLIWLYSARVTNAAAIVAVTAVALFWAHSFAPVLFVIALLPMTLFLGAAINSDSLLIAVTIGSASLVRALIERRFISGFMLVTLSLFCLLIGLSKFAYFPIAAAALVVAFIQRQRIDRVVLTLSIVMIVIFVVSISWSIYIKSA